MEFRIIWTKEIKTLLENEINNRDIILKKYKELEIQLVLLVKYQQV